MAAFAAIAAVVIYVALTDENLPGEPVVPSQRQIEDAARQLITARIGKRKLHIEVMLLAKSGPNKWAARGSLKGESSRSLSTTYFAALLNICQDQGQARCWMLDSLTIDGRKVALDATVAPVARAATAPTALTASKAGPEKTRKLPEPASAAPAAEVASTPRKSETGDGVRRRLTRKNVPVYSAKYVSHPKGAPAIPVPMALVRGVHPVITALVNDIKVNLLIDTGSNRTFLSQEMFGPGTSGGQHPVIESLCYENGICFEEVAVRLSVSNYTQSGGNTYNGILGTDLLRTFGLTIDYREKKVYFSIPADASGQRQEFPFTMDKTSRPHITVFAGGQAFANTLLDTGATYTRVTPAMIAKFGTKPAARYNEMAFAINRLAMTRIVGLRNYCVGISCRPGLDVQIGNWAAVGGSFFHNYLTSFDFQGRRILLRPYDAAWQRPKNANQRLGIQMSIFDPGFIVWVRPDTAAAAAGLQTGDVVETINGRNVSDLGYIGVNAALEKTSTRTYVLVIRGEDGARKTVTLAVH